MVAVYLPGVSFAIASARPCAKVFTVSQSAFGVSGTTTWRPLPPVVFTKLSSRIARSRSRTSFAASINAVHGTSSPGSRSKVIRSGASTFEILEPQGWISNTLAWTRGDEAVEVLDIEHLIVADVPPLD